jgi:acetolactate synthase-1/2/3 large subunit
MDSLESPLRPQRIIAELRRAMPADGILFVDIGNVMAWALHYFEVQVSGDLFH